MEGVYPMRITTTVACAVALLLGTNSAVRAQEASGTAKAGNAKSVTLLEEVTVTGTRIKQREDYVSPNPIQTIDSTEMQRLGIVNISDALTRVPANVSNFSPANMGASAFFVGSTLANLRGLNPFFGTRTLTLVDTHRFIPTTQGDSVDLNFIPSNLIDRTEIVTGGASAAYGSGAIAGVVNVLLNHKLQGVKLDADYGASEHGDGQNYHVGLAGGSDLFDGRGHFILGGEYQKSDVIQSCADARDWCKKGVGAFLNDTVPFDFTPGVTYTAKIPGQPWNIITGNLRNNQISTSGVIFSATPGVTTTSQLNAAGTDIAPFAVGAEGWRGAGGTVIGGDGTPIYQNISLFPDLDRKTGYGQFTFNFTDSLSGFLEASYGQVKGTNHQWDTLQNIAQNCIRADNAYLASASAATKAAIAANIGNSPFATFSDICFGGTIVSKDWSAQDDQTVTTDTKVTRSVVGLKGSFGTSTWTWETYYQYGKTTRDQIGAGYMTNHRYVFATDAVIDTRPGSPTLGQPVCRVTIDGVIPPGVDPSLAQSCQPLNVFGTTNASPQAMAYAFGNLTEHDNIRQDVVAGSVSGELWQGWGAGPLASAAGLEYRKDKLDNLAGDQPFAQRTDFALQYGDSFGGTTKVREGFLELEMPLLKDKPGARLATVNGAIRKAKYDNQGGVGTTGGHGTQDITTWKLAAVWDPLEWLRFRGSHSRDIRAASFRELYYSQSIPAGGIFGSVQNSKIVPNPPFLTGTDSAVIVLSGNPNLTPETATTTTAGFVLTPSEWIENMHFSADYWKIKLAGGQALENSQLVVNQCYDGSDPSKCNQITFGTPLPGQGSQSNISQVRALYINANPYALSGVDIAWDYLLPMSKLLSKANGNLSFRLSSTYALKTMVNSAGGQKNVASQTGGDQGFFSDFAPSPKFSGTLTISYLNGPLSVTTQGRYISAGRLDKQNPKLGPGDAGYDPTLTYSVNDSTVPSYFVMSLDGSYDFKWFGLQNVQLFADVQNLFDRDPPFSSPNTMIGVGGVNAIFFDTLGRTYRVGMRMSF